MKTGRVQVKYFRQYFKMLTWSNAAERPNKIMIEKNPLELMRKMSLPS